jgi:hypothetical protein
MDSDGKRIAAFRQMVVTSALTAMAAAMVLFALVLIGGGYFFCLVGIVIAMAAFGGLHYLLWGRLMVRETAGEREEELLRERALAEDGSEPPDERIWR